MTPRAARRGPSGAAPAALLALAATLVAGLNDAHPLLGRRVITAGLGVHCRDARADLEFRRVVQSRAADLGPFLERMRAMKLASLRR